MYHLGFFNFCNGVSELQMKLPNFLGYFNTFVFIVCIDTEILWEGIEISLAGYCL